MPSRRRAMAATRSSRSSTWRAHALRDFGELFVGFHVDGAELVALAAELGEACVEGVGVGDGFFFGRILVAVFCACGAGGGDDLVDAGFEFFEVLVERGADLFGDFGLAADGGFEAGFGADQCFARGGGLFAGEAGAEFGLAQGGVCFGQRVGGGAAGGVCGFGRGRKFVEFLLERGGLVFCRGVSGAGSRRDRG